ncbi:MAG TPA: carboxypeptidase regulatory-like domain-containing protein [Vicinamibacterales bacterium]|nr:carboxypeptidase regulatory-like domain-containing protein [Vicinamibacterales bacterium]
MTARLRCIRTALLALCVALVAAPAIAQFDRSQVSGRVKDSQGGLVPGATVTVTNQATQLTTTAVTDQTGFYTFPNLTSGKYTISTELQGFKKVVRPDVTLDAAASVTIDFTLETGALTESVTVTADSPVLQTDTSMRKTIESKDIEQIPFSGRNPIGVVGLKPGVVGGSFNNYNFSDLGNGGFSINGSRSDENNITVDGATAIRTRSSGAIVGIQNVDALQEVQVLTGNYMPEYGRASGGQVRMVTKSGGNRFHGSGSFFLRDDKLQANTWTRNKSPNALENSGPAPFDYKQYAYSVGGPIQKDRLFFFAAQEWVNYVATETRTLAVPTEKMRTGDFSELLLPNNVFFAAPQIIRDPTTGQPFPGNIIPANRLSSNGLAFLRAYPLPTPGFRSGVQNAIINSTNPQDQRKDNIRLDYRLNAKNSFVYRYGKYNWVAIDAFRGDVPYARTDWDRPNTNQTLSWTSSLSNTLVNEASYTYGLDEVFINVLESDLYKRSTYGVTYPYLFPQNKEIADKLPTISIDNLGLIDGGPYPAFSRGPIHTFSNTTTWVKDRHTFKGGLVIEYSGEDDFDQINVQPIPGSTNNQNGRFEFRNSTTARSGLGMADAALGLFTNYAEIGQRALTKWRALATDVFVQDSWRPTAKLTVEGGIRYVLWPPWYSTTNNIASFDPRFYDRNNEAVVNPSNGVITGGPRYNGIVLPGDGFPSEASNLAVYNDPAVRALFRDLPRGFTRTYKNVFEPRGGVSYAWNEMTVFKASAGVFHNRVTLNDSLLPGGNPPFQPQVSVSNGSADNPGGAGGAAALPLGMTAIDPNAKIPVAYTYSVGVQRQLPFGFAVDVTYVGRQGRNLQRERNINQLAAGTLQRNPGINSAALRPYKGYGVIRLSEHEARSEYNSLQIGVDRRYRNGFKFGAAYTLGKSMDDASGRRDVLFNAFDDSGYWGHSSFDRRHVFNFYYIYDLPFLRDQTTILGRTLGGWQISGSTFMRTGTPLWVTRTADIAGVGDAFAQPYNQNGDPMDGANGQFSQGAAADQNFWFNPQAFSAPAAGTFGNAPRNGIYGPGQYQWDIAVFKNFAVRSGHTLQFRAEIFNFINHPNWSNPNTDPTSTSFGRVTGKDNARRDVQLSLRYVF